MGAFFRGVVRPLLFLNDPEAAHERAIGWLGALQRRPGLLKLIEAACRPAETPVSVLGLTFPGRLGLAAGFDKNAEVVRALAALGFAFVEVGTVTYVGQPGNPKPRLFRLPEDGALLNRLGFNNVGSEAVAANLRAARGAGCVIGVNVGKNKDTPLEAAPEEYRKTLLRLWPFGDYFTVNISSPNTQDLRKLHEPERLNHLLSTVSLLREAKKVHKPIFVKISPDLDDDQVAETAKRCADFGYGVVAVNTTLSRAGLAARWAGETGGVSGAPLEKRSLEVIERVKRATGGKTPVIGVGGVLDAAAYRRKLDAGADLVQLYTGFVYRGPFAVKEILR